MKITKKYIQRLVLEEMTNILAERPMMTMVGNQGFKVEMDAAEAANQQYSEESGEGYIPLGPDKGYVYIDAGTSPEEITATITKLGGEPEVFRKVGMPAEEKLTEMHEKLKELKTLGPDYAKGAAPGRGMVYSEEEATPPFNIKGGKGYQKISIPSNLVVDKNQPGWQSRPEAVRAPEAWGFIEARSDAKYVEVMKQLSTNEVRRRLSIWNMYVVEAADKWEEILDLSGRLGKMEKDYVEAAKQMLQRMTKELYSNPHLGISPLFNSPMPKSSKGDYMAGGNIKEVIKQEILNFLNSKDY